MSGAGVGAGVGLGVGAGVGASVGTGVGFGVGAGVGGTHCSVVGINRSSSATYVVPVHVHSLNGNGKKHVHGSALAVQLFVCTLLGHVYATLPSADNATQSNPLSVTEQAPVICCRGRHVLVIVPLRGHVASHPTTEEHRPNRENTSLATVF